MAETCRHDTGGGGRGGIAEGKGVHGEASMEDVPAADRQQTNVRAMVTCREGGPAKRLPVPASLVSRSLAQA